MALPFRVPIKMAPSARIPARPGRLWSDVFFQTEISVSISLFSSTEGVNSNTAAMLIRRTKRRSFFNLGPFPRSQKRFWKCQ